MPTSLCACCNDFVATTIALRVLVPDANGWNLCNAAQFHVASNPALAQAGGQLFDDNVGLFTNCGQPAEDCGRVVQQPALATDPSMRKALWKKSKALVKAYNTPLGQPWEKPEMPKKKRIQVDEDGEQEVHTQEQPVQEDWGVADKEEPEKVVDEDQFFDDDEGEL